MSAISVLEAAVGRSRRQIARILAGDDAGKKPWDNARATFIRSARRIIAAGRRSEEATKLKDLAEKVIKATKE